MTGAAAGKRFPPATRLASELHRIGLMRPNGFTLIETLVATAILVWGLVAVAQLFFYSIQSTIATERKTAGMVLAHGKIEELRAAGPEILADGGSLDPETKMSGYWDSPGVEVPYLRLWQVARQPERTITVVVYGPPLGAGQRRVELMRVSTIVASRF